MKKNTGKWVFMTGVLCILSLAVCACEKTETESIPETGIEGTGTGKEPPETISASDTSVEQGDNTPDLEGEISVLEDGQLTVVEYATEKTDDGGDIMISPGNGDDSEFHKVTVIYDENTSLAVQTIYDGGARSEMSEATLADLAEGQHIQVWGSLSESGLKATQIRIVKVA